MSFVIAGAEFTGDLRLALDARPVSPSPTPSDSLDITAELAEPTPATVATSDQHLSSTADGPPLPAVTSSDQSLVRLKLDLPKSSAAGGSLPIYIIIRTVMASVLSGQSFLVTLLITVMLEQREMLLAFLSYLIFSCIISVPF